MSSRLDSLFEEDVQMQDALEDLGSFTDNSDDIILGVIEDRAPKFICSPMNPLK